jgi:hypothetical protein
VKIADFPVAVVPLRGMRHWSEKRRFSCRGGVPVRYEALVKNSPVEVFDIQLFSDRRRESPPGSHKADLVSLRIAEETSIKFDAARSQRCADHGRKSAYSASSARRTCGSHGWGSRSIRCWCSPWLLSRNPLSEEQSDQRRGSKHGQRTP